MYPVLIVIIPIPPQAVTYQIQYNLWLKTTSWLSKPTLLQTNYTVWRMVSFTFDDCATTIVHVH